MNLIQKMWGRLCVDGILIDPVRFVAAVAIVLDYVEAGHKDQLVRDLEAVAAKLTNAKENE